MAGGRKDAHLAYHKIKAETGLEAAQTSFDDQVSTMANVYHA